MIGIGEALAGALEAKKRGEGAVIVTVVAGSVDGTAPGGRMLVSETRRSGSIHPNLDALLVEEAYTRLESGRAGLRSYSVREDGAQDVGVRGGDVDVYFDVLPRSPHLIVVGAGHIAVPLARMASLLDFRVTVLDDRPEFATQERFPTADRLLVGPYRETLSTLALDPQTHVVLVTRGHVHDQACLQLVAGSRAAYIGMIGSKRRVRTVMRHLQETGTDPEALSRVYAPVGLDIGSETPAEIALAIMAEIVNLRRGGRGPSLADRRSPGG